MHSCVCVHALDLWIVPVLCDGKSPGFFHRSWVSKCVSYVFAEVWATSGSLSHAVFEEAGRNMLKAVSQWGARAEGGAPLRKRLVEYQGFRSSTDFLIDTADCSLCSSIHFFHYFLFFLSSLTPFSSSSSIHLHSVFMLPPITTLMILNLWLDSFYFESIQPYIRLSTWVENYGGILSCTATVMSADMSAPSVKKKKSFARSSKPSTRMCIREQRDIM